MARQKTAVVVPAETEGVNTQGAAELLTEGRAVIAQVQQQDLAELTDLSASIGAIQAMELVNRFVSSATLRLFQQIRESKRIKDLPIRMADGSVSSCHSMRDACPLLFGRSYETMLREEADLAVLGDQAYDIAQRLGLNRVALRAARALPPEKLETVRQAIAAGSTKAEVLSVIEDLAERAQKAEEKTLDVQAELQVSNEAREKLGKRIDKMEAERRRYNKLPPDQQLTEMQTRATAVKDDLLGGIKGALRQACLEIGKHGADAREHELFLAGLLGEVQRALNAVRDEFRLPDVSRAEDKIKAGALHAIAVAAQKER